MKTGMAKLGEIISSGVIDVVSIWKTLAMLLLVVAAPSFMHPQSASEPGAPAKDAQTSAAQPASQKGLVRNKSGLLEFHEDWTQLSIQGLGLEQWAATPGGKAEGPQLTRELVRLEWRPDDPVDLYISIPKGVRKPRVILYLYGYPSDAARFTADDWCNGAVQGGFAAVGFVSALTGERYRHRALTEWFVGNLQESLATTTHDVQMILNYLETRGDLNTDRVAMYAQGSGAAIAILAASVEPRIKVLDLLNPWGDWPEWLKKSSWIDENERPRYLRSEFLEKVSGLDPVQVLPKLTQVVRLQQVKDDRITPTEARERIAALVPAGATVFQSDNWAAYGKAWKEKKLWDWAKEKLEPRPVQAQSVLPADKQPLNPYPESTKDGNSKRH